MLVRYSGSSLTAHSSVVLVVSENTVLTTIVTVHQLRAFKITNLIQYSEESLKNLVHHKSTL